MCYIKSLSKSDSLALTNAGLLFERDVSELQEVHPSISSLIVEEQLATPPTKGRHIEDDAAVVDERIFW